jgi:uncharacterized protein (UPF0332 family)/predicted nucleotidyltransferase
VLDLKDVDLDDLCQALDDHSYEHSWWLDPQSGEVVLWSDWAEGQGEPHPDSRGCRFIEPTPSHEAYADMEDFIAGVRDPRARDLLERSIAGRGAFRRFKDTLFDFPELREAWFRFGDARAERRAIGWLLNAGLIAAEQAEQAIAARPDPDLPALGGALDPDQIAKAVASDLRELYGERLKKVLLFGSWARGDAHPESDIDLLVVLDRVESVWDELRRMNDVLDRHSVENDTVVSALVITESELAEPRLSLPFGLERARAELAAARLLAGEGFGAQAISRAYYAAFCAAGAALGALGETRSKHSGIVAAFDEVVVRNGGVEPAASKRLRSLFRQRQEADYGTGEPSADDAESAIDDAEQVVDAVQNWLAQRLE